MTTAVRVSQLTKRFGGNTVLDGISLQLQPGEVVLLRGPNGSGKSTLLRILSGFEAADSGDIVLEGERAASFRFPLTFLQQWRFAPETLARLGVARLWQSSRLFPTQTLQTNVALSRRQAVEDHPLRALLFPKRVAAERLSAAAMAMDRLREAGLEAYQHSLGRSISLGQARRVEIMRVISAGASVVLLDEPLSGLDAAGVDLVMEFLHELRTKRNVSVVIAEHDANVTHLAPVADTEWALSHGKLGSNDSIAGVEPGRGVDALLEAVAPGHTFVTSRQPLGAGATLTIASREDGDGRPVTIGLQNAIVWRGGRAVLAGAFADGGRGVSFALRRGDIAILEAPNGWGKTSLLEAIAGFHRYDGVIEIRGLPVSHLPAWEISRSGVTLLSSRSPIFPGLTVNEVLELFGAEADSFVLRLRRRRMRQLSGGETRRVALCCVLARKGIQLLDEPFSGLDSSARTEVASRLRSVPHETVVIATPSTV